MSNLDAVSCLEAVSRVLILVLVSGDVLVLGLETSPIDKSASVNESPTSSILSPKENQHY